MGLSRLVKSNLPTIPTKSRDISKLSSCTGSTFLPSILYPECSAVRRSKGIGVHHTVLEKPCRYRRQLSPLSQLLSGWPIPKSGKGYSDFGISSDIVCGDVWLLFVAGLRRLVVKEGYEERASRLTISNGEDDGTRDVRQDCGGTA